MQYFQTPKIDCISIAFFTHLIYNESIILKEV